MMRVTKNLGLTMGGVAAVTRGTGEVTSVALETRSNGMGRFHPFRGRNATGGLARGRALLLHGSVVLLSLVVLNGCSGDSSVGDPPVPVGDSGSLFADSAAQDAKGDSSFPDSAPDVAPDTASDTSADSGGGNDALDSAVADSHADTAGDSPADVAIVDAALDVIVETGSEDVGADSGSDVSADVSVDSAADANSDVSLDVGLDTAQDSGVDVGVDTTVLRRGVDVGVDTAVPGCKTGKDCDDKVSCTIDSCAAGVCYHWVAAPGTTSACSPGQVCDPVKGCVLGKACATKEQCEKLFADDPCKWRIACNAVTSSCEYTVLDKDNDGHPPIVCGGDDCNDADYTVHPGVVDACGTADKDCDGKPGAVCASGLECGYGICCPPGNACKDGCRDLASDVTNCGTCGNECLPGEVCSKGGCVCAPGWVRCNGLCVEVAKDPKNCGGCGNSCSVADGSSCSAGKCSCAPGQESCGGSCAYLENDFRNCGLCGKSCASGEICSKGKCTGIVGGVTEMATLPLRVGHFKMDRLEVTVGQYNEWLKLSPSLAGAPSRCTKNVLPEQKDCTVCDLPVNWVDWCDAEAYCRSVGKRMCGTVAMFRKSYVSGNIEFDVACFSSRGPGYESYHAYTYPGAYDKSKCNTDSGARKSVGSMPLCHSDRVEYSSVMDLTGNVAEWEDVCNGNSCNIRGGDYGTSSMSSECGWTPSLESSSSGGYVGFRCCADAAQ